MGFSPDRLNAEIDRVVMTNDELARALGIPERSIRRWRKGAATPRRRTGRRLAEFFEREPNFFYSDEAGA